ncbi:hypothetical protein [Parabacteroides sp. FAFU027]|uniref:hypothetical protein n=1 Tax=Parabacteroides sp. FAFU027 TaxID=2922715 RepID=UPI001FAF98FA|nr:hypothetical protein [Parabacteroides sp. FAFU027]
MQKYILVLVILMLGGKVFALNPVDVYEATVKIEKDTAHEYMCGLAEGDQLIFSCESERGGKLEKIEVLEYPSSLKFSDYLTSEVKPKTITITSTGIYLFRFTNAEKKPKVFRYKIQRIPAGEQTVRFNPTVYWKTATDTVWYNDGQQSTTVTDTVIHNLTDRLVKVHSKMNSGGNRTSFSFTLPQGTIAYSYYVGVNQSGSKAFADATGSLLRSTSPFISKIPGYGPLAALAMNGTSFLTTLVSGESVKYWIADALNGNLFNVEKPFKYIKYAEVVNDFSRMTAPLKGTYFICLQNENKLQSIDVTLKVTAVALRQKKIIRPIRKFRLESKSEPYLKN